MATPVPFQLAQPPAVVKAPAPKYRYDRYNFIIKPVTTGNNGPNFLPGSGANSAGAPPPACTPKVDPETVTPAENAADTFQPAEPLWG